MKVKVFGKEYPRVRDACEMNHVSTATMYRIMRENEIYDNAKAIEIAIKQKENRSYGRFCKMIREHGYKNIYELSAAVNVPYSTIYRRFLKGVPWERAIQSKYMDKHGIECTVFGKTYISRPKACRVYGIDYNYIRKHAIETGRTFEEEFERYCTARGKKPIENMEED